MLVLSRKPGERIHIGNGITLSVLRVSGNRVRIGIEAPDSVHIVRGEIAGQPATQIGRLTDQNGKPCGEEALQAELCLI